MLWFRNEALKLRTYPRVIDFDRAELWGFCLPRSLPLSLRLSGPSPPSPRPCS
ncbi:hypothetical protein COCCADRAFT_82657 [Bipolaris zeicola 26-R-13]|uniref:Uncharacterized protein n=1 Tax=Cochliobolus carbonum (strain 26-R-13) TaxID=930089 RepID=W6YLE9_COCC2|nr:uncharacterized protein COCCADRAFT_82657 [Bipolaris zeicola 26-R-13]EUC38575.1 hypothetical protein COCCADRAFT_82657 [Bipolaris zeicola 26-R-13]